MAIAPFHTARGTRSRRRRLTFLRSCFAGRGSGGAEGNGGGGGGAACSIVSATESSSDRNGRSEGGEAIGWDGVRRAARGGGGGGGGRGGSGGSPLGACAPALAAGGARPPR